MAKNLKKAALAAGSVFALSASLLVAPAATAAAGDVTIRPTAGTGTTAFATDDFELSTSIRTAAVNPTTLAYRIENPDQNQLYIDLKTTASSLAVTSFTAVGYKEDGTAVNTGLGALTSRDVLVDFADLDIVSLVIHSISATPTATGSIISVKLDESPVTNATDNPTLNALDYGDLTSATSITVQSWVEASATPNYATVDAEFASAVQSVTFIDPSSVSVVSTIQRIVDLATTNGAANYRAIRVRAATTANVVDITLAGGTADVTDIDAGDTMDGVTLAAGDYVLLAGQTDATQNGIYEVKAAGTAPGSISTNVSGLVYVAAGSTFADKVFSADGTNGVYYVRAAATGNIADIVGPANDISSGEDSVGGVALAANDVILLAGQTTATENGLYSVKATGTAPTTVTDALAHAVFVNEGTAAGRIFTAEVSNVPASSATISDFNAATETSLGLSMRFSNTALNLAQVDLGQWEFLVDGAANDDTGYLGGELLKPGTPAGYTAVDGLGRLLIPAPVADASLGQGQSYVAKFRHSGDTVAPILEYTTPGFEVITSPASHTGARITAVPTTSTDASVGTYASGSYPVAIRNGVSTVTYRSQVREADNDALETANIPVMAVVTAGSAFPTGATLTVSGATETIKAAGATMVVTGLTDSKGNWSVSVTSSDTAAAGSAYKIQFYVLDSTADNVWRTVAVTGENAVYSADYASGSLATGGFTADSTVLSGSDLTVTFSVKDQFGQPLSATATGRAYSVELKAPSKTNLEQFVAVTGGKATFTFKNYLKAGESDILTAKLFTGSSTSPSYVSGATVFITLYNSNPVAAVNVPAEITGVIVTYDDFITGVASATNIAPTDGANTGTGEDFVLNGTVVDANGAGVPGASVTISGKGFQFVRNGGDTYFVDSITLAATEAGTFSVRGWTTVASATGNNITVTSAGKSATVKVKSKVEDGNNALSAANLSFTWDLPATLVMNTTYAVTATVTDKWGNPIKGAEIDFEGFAAAQFNGAAKATRTTAANGKATAFLRSLKDVDGVSAVGATLKSIDQNANSAVDVNNLGAVLLDNTATKWDESKWTNVLEKSVNFLKSGSGAAAGTGKVNVGSFNGKLVVYASGLNGARISWKVGGNWGSAVADSNYDIFNRPTPRAGVTVSVQIYVNGVLTLTKSVLTR